MKQENSFHHIKMASIEVNKNKFFGSWESDFDTCINNNNFVYR